MDIRNDEDLKIAVEQASVLLQSIQNYTAKRNCTHAEIPQAKVRFPRGFLRTAEFQRQRLNFVKDKNLRSNLAYTLMLSDAVLWVLIRTDISGTAGDMLCKLFLFLLGTLTESMTKDYLKGICGKNYKVRTQYLVEQKIIDEVLKEDLDWLWDVRNRMHLFQLEQKEHSNEYNSYSHIRAVETFRGLLYSLGHKS